jgi:predicted RNase H-like HicB family nuclease
MIDTVQDVDIEERDGQFIATIPKLGATVTGATHAEVLKNAQRAIVEAMIAEAEKRKRQRRGKHTGA